MIFLTKKYEPVHEICEAIRGKKWIEFLYDGSIRTVEPYAYGITTKGRECVNGYQVSENNSSEKFGWRMFDLRKAGAITVLEKTFAKPRVDYVRGGSGMKKVFGEV